MESTEILQELESIRAFLFLILVINGGMLVCSFIVMTFFVRATKGLRDFARSRNAALFREEGPNLLAQNKIEELLTEIEKRLKTHPNDPYAYFYRGQGLFAIEKYHDSKRAFIKANELEPSMSAAVERWTNRISEKLKETSPRIVE